MGKDVREIWTVYCMYCGVSVAMKMRYFIMQVGQGIWECGEVPGANYSLYITGTYSMKVIGFILCLSRNVTDVQRFVSV